MLRQSNLSQRQAAEKGVLGDTPNLVEMLHQEGGAELMNLNSV